MNDATKTEIERLQDELLRFVTLGPNSVEYLRLDASPEPTYFRADDAPGDPFGFRKQCVLLRRELLSQGYDIDSPPQSCLDLLDWLSDVESVLPGTENGEHLAKEPSKIATQAYMLYTSMGISQVDVAKTLTEQYRPTKPYRQYQVARWVNVVRSWRKANDLPTDQEYESGSHVSVDPETIDLGGRTYRRATEDGQEDEQEDKQENE